ncbi:MAG TPA: methyltransferase domain-containing protein [archaeon]|nr:methyltransferase domain-containing protein [archaeon]
MRRLNLRLAEIRERMRRHDLAHDNAQKANKHSNELTKLTDSTLTTKYLLERERRVNPRMRVVEHYATAHAILEHVAKQNLKGKKILHLAASTGVYVKFLETECGANAIAIDIDSISLTDAKTRGVKSVRGDAIPRKELDEFKLLPSGVWVPKKPFVVNHLPFKDNSFDFVISDHFLFSNYNRDIPTEPGFEIEKGSIARSEDSLTELNRILIRGGVVLVSQTHLAETPGLREYVQGFKKSGFNLEKAYDIDLNRQKSGIPYYFVLRKIKET